MFVCYWRDPEVGFLNSKLFIEDIHRIIYSTERSTDNIFMVLVIEEEMHRYHMVVFYLSSYLLSLSPAYGRRKGKANTN